MDPRDVNRINYNNYFVGQNLDFLVRSKMRSESLSTPLKNTPAFYDDQVTSKMSLLGKRGFYDPGYIYGFQNSEEINNEYKSNYHYAPFYPKENMRIYDKYQSGMERNKDKIPNLNYAQQINEYNYINDLDKKNVGDLVLPPTKNQILQEVYLENFNKKHSPK